MDFVKILEVANRKKVNLHREEELSTGDKVVFIDHLPVSTIRAVSKVIANSALVKEENSLLYTVDETLMDITTRYVLIKYLTDIDIAGTDMSVLYDALDESALWEEIKKKLDPVLVSRIKNMSIKYIEEEKRKQKIEGLLGYQVNEIVNKILKDKETNLAEILEKYEEISSKEKEKINK